MGTNRAAPGPCPACAGPGPIAVVSINGSEYALCRVCVALFVATHAQFAPSKPRK